MALVVTSPLVNPIAEALAANWARDGLKYDRDYLLADATASADAVIAVVAALPHDHSAGDVLAFIRGEDGPSKHIVDGAPC